MSVSLVETLKPINLSIDKIYLDPNNPRFLDRDWEYISDDNITDESIQDAVKHKMRTNFGIDKLAANIKLNGFLKIDRIIVQRILDSKEYVVLEGNMRMCAVKLLHEQLETDSRIDENVLSSITDIECLEYIGTDPQAAWIFQGLRHISGITDWPPFNKAKLLVNQMESEDLTLTQVGERFGISPYAAGQWMRGYKAYDQANKESDYIQELDMRSYAYFQEIFGRSSVGIREWLEWDEGTGEFQNRLNLNEFIGWLYPKEDDESDAFGDWEKRHLNTRDDLRQLSYLYQQAPRQFNEFRRDLDLEKAYAKALSLKQEAKNKDATSKTFEALSNCKNALDNVPAKALRNFETKSQLITEIKKLVSVIEEIIPEALEKDESV
ncbi:hypothetical protein [Lewinella sp. IMCC34183]|uniref:hypothetical protein n=1 Tax=Lewinella sp. IMCC34183 TaxID=2248762 RepID=UPI0013001AF7|nr:hypothetical protein [Lewinella sp. IMCC34183]